MKSIWIAAWMYFVLTSAALAAASGQDFAALAKRCSPEVHPLTMAALVRKESGFDPLVIGVNGTPHLTIHPATLKAGVNVAEELIQQGKSIDIGLGQVNNQNFRKLGLSVADAFDPCRNLAAASRLLTAAYRQYRSAGLDEASALDASLSSYNTGDSGAGINNGYVGDVREIADGGVYVVPSLASKAASTDATALLDTTVTERRPVEAQASWDVFGGLSGDAAGFVLSPKTSANDDKSTQTSAPSTGTVRGVSQGVVSGGGTASQPKDGPVVLFAEPSDVANGRPSPPS